MNKMLASKESRMGSAAAPARHGGVLDWQSWAPYAVIAWSLIYAALGIYWVLSGRGFPYSQGSMSDGLGPLLGRLGPGVAWNVAIMAGIPAAAMGLAMLRGVRGSVLRPLFITAGVLLAWVLLLLMTGLDLLVKVGYLPAALLGHLPAEKSQAYVAAWTQWSTIHQLLCLVGGFLWLGATVCYARWSGDACVYCGRRDGPEGWTSPVQAARWGRIAVYVAMVAPIFYALTRFAWVLGLPLGLSEQQFRNSQENAQVISGALSLGAFVLVGAVLMLGLVQRWGEVFPRWMIGLAGRRVPVALAVVPASLASVLLIVGGIGIWFGLPQMITNAAAAGAAGIELAGEIIFQLGPTLLFPVWGIALAAATLGYYYRRRGACNVCGRGASEDVGKQSSTYRLVT